LLNAAVDMVRKIVAPGSYPCALCSLTYGPFTMRNEWRRFLDRLGLPVLALYRDELREDLDTRGIALPAILLGGQSGPPEVLVSASDMADLPDLRSLIALVEQRLAEHT
jgi:hypothetical protein